MCEFFYVYLQDINFVLLTYSFLILTTNNYLASTLLSEQLARTQLLIFCIRLAKIEEQYIDKYGCKSVIHACKNRYVGIFFFTESEELSGQLSSVLNIRNVPFASKAYILAHQDHKVPGPQARLSVQLNPSSSLPTQKQDE
jgi:hypothetical protein